MRDKPAPPFGEAGCCAPGRYFRPSPRRSTKPGPSSYSGTMNNRTCLPVFAALTLNLALLPVPELAAQNARQAAASEHGMVSAAQPLATGTHRMPDWPRTIIHSCVAGSTVSHKLYRDRVANKPISAATIQE